MTAVSGEAGADRLLRALLDESGDPLLAVDERGTIVEANAAAELRLGRVRGSAFVSLLAAGDRRRVGDALAALRDDGRELARVRFEARGGQAQLALRVLPGVLPRTVAIRIAEPADPPLDRTFRRFPIAVLAVRRDLRVAFATDGARRLLGRDACLPEPLRALAERVVAGRVPARALALELPGGRMVRVSAVPPLGDDPALLLLEEMSAAERHEHVMHEFVRNAAHQLRTPITAIAGAVEVLQGGAKNDPAALDRFLGHVAEHVARMARLTHGLLVLARAQSGEQAPRLDPVELGPLLARLADATPGVEVETSCPPSLTALAEPDLVEEALLALLENAAKHTRAGRVHIAASEVEGRAVIEVVDDGPGILPEHRARILEPFYRLEGGGDGIGLGLAIAAQAVRAMDGDLSVDGVDGGGAAFRVRLPSAGAAR